jgi:hypothetical protein
LVGEVVGGFPGVDDEFGVVVVHADTLARLGMSMQAKDGLVAPWIAARTRAGHLS